MALASLVASLAINYLLGKGIAGRNCARLEHIFGKWPEGAHQGGTHRLQGSTTNLWAKGQELAMLGQGEEHTGAAR